jgi:peptide deformylase
MIDTMRVEKGVGLAAPQIGVSQQVLVIQMPEDEDDDVEKPESGKLYVLCNPKIVRRRGEEEGVEGCLSLPGFAGDVPRATTVIVRGQNPQGEPLRIKAQGFLARVFQHEIDHLHGNLYIDRVEDPDKIWTVDPMDEDGESL